MSTADEVLKSINVLNAEIRKSLQRCQNAPYSNFPRTKKIQQLQDEADAASARAAAEVQQLEAPVREASARRGIELTERQQRLADLQRRHQDSQRVFHAKNAEWGVRNQALPASVDRSPLNEERAANNRAFETSTAEYNRVSSELQSEINELQAQQAADQGRVNLEATQARRVPASESLQAAEVEMQGLLDRAGTLEKEIATGASVELMQKAQATFRDKTGDFSEAEKHHEAQARLMFGAMFLVLILSAFAIYQLFVKPQVQGSSAADLSAPKAATNPAAPAEGRLMQGKSGEDTDGTPTRTMLNVERIVLLATGRIAILLFLAWALKYLAELHRAHSEQAIIYRDRKAALGVAELLLNATPEIEQKREMLKSLTTVYLHVSDSAFIQRRPNPAEADADFDRQVKRLKQAVDAVKPVLEIAGKATEKAK
jgi:hypothetical protein